MIIVDSSVWIGLLHETDSNHEAALNLFKDNDNFEIFDHFYAEVLNVLKRKASIIIAAKFIALLQRLDMHLRYTDYLDIEDANQFFFHFKNLSFTDCLLMAIAKRNNAEILTFDKNLNEAWNKLKN